VSKVLLELLNLYVIYSVNGDIYGHSVALIYRAKYKSSFWTG